MTSPAHMRVRPSCRTSVRIYPSRSSWRRYFYLDDADLALILSAAAQGGVGVFGDLAVEYVPRYTVKRLNGRSGWRNAKGSSGREATPQRFGTATGARRANARSFSSIDP